MRKLEALALFGMIVAILTTFGLVAASHAMRDRSPHAELGARLPAAPSAATGDGKPWQL